MNSENKENDYIFQTSSKRPGIAEQNSHYSFKKHNTDLKTELKNLDANLNLYSFPTFSDILDRFLELHSENAEVLCHRFMLCIRNILDSKQKDNEEKIAMIERIQRLENERHHYDSVINRSKKEFSDLTVKYEKLKFTTDESKDAFRKERQKLEDERDKEIKMHQKLLIRETQLNNEIRKKEVMYDKLTEQFKKLHERQGVKNEMTISYNLGKNTTAINAIFLDGKSILIHELNVESENKVNQIYNENLTIRKVLLDVYNDLVQLITDKKKTYSSVYYDIYGKDNEHLSWKIAKLNLNTISLDLDPTVFVSKFTENFHCLREIIAGTDELKPLLNTNCLNIGSLYNDYTANLLHMLDSLNKLNFEYAYLLENVYKFNTDSINRDYLNSQPKELNWDLLKDHKQDSEKYFENIKSIVENNSQIFGHYLEEIEKRKKNSELREHEKLQESERILLEKNKATNDEIMFTFKRYMSIIDNIRTFDN
jgi:hypothetical protein